jgi:hypothetical protein
VARLRKAEAAALLRTFDQDPVGSLTVALRIALDEPSGSWQDLVGRLRADRRGPLLARRAEALDALAAELNELRTAPTGPDAPSTD